MSLTRAQGIPEPGYLSIIGAAENYQVVLQERATFFTDLKNHTSISIFSILLIYCRRALSSQ